jgi:chromosome segregation ATPase
VYKYALVVVEADTFDSETVSEMSANAGKVIPKTTANGISSLEEASGVTRAFVSAVKVLSSDNGYQHLVELVDRIPKLEADLREKEKALKAADENWKNGQTTHTAELKKHLQLYAEGTERVGKEKVGLEQKIVDLQKNLDLKNKEIAGLREKEESLKEAGRKIETLYKGMKTKLEEKDNEINVLKNQGHENKTMIETLNASQKASQNETSALKKSLDQAQLHNGHIGKSLEVALRRLKEMDSYTVKLTETDPNIM